MLHVTHLGRHGCFKSIPEFDEVSLQAPRRGAACRLVQLFGRPVQLSVYHRAPEYCAWCWLLASLQIAETWFLACGAEWMDVRVGPNLKSMEVLSFVGAESPIDDKIPLPNTERQADKPVIAEEVKCGFKSNGSSLIGRP